MHPFQQIRLMQLTVWFIWRWQKVYSLSKSLGVASIYKNLNWWKFYIIAALHTGSPGWQTDMKMWRRVQNCNWHAKDTLGWFRKQQVNFSGPRFLPVSSMYDLQIAVANLNSHASTWSIHCCKTYLEISSPKFCPEIQDTCTCTMCVQYKNLSWKTTLWFAIQMWPLQVVFVDRFNYIEVYTRTFCQEYLVFQDRWSLMAVVSQGTGFTVTGW